MHVAAKLAGRGAFSASATAVTSIVKPPFTSLVNEPIILAGEQGEREGE
jgi:hypothetical protein